MPLRLTRTKLAEEFQRIGFRPNALRGQCFLVDLNMLQAVVQSAWLKPSEVALEVGFGPGNLTAEIAAHAGFVLGFEVEPLLYRLARENLDYVPNVRLILADAIESKWKLNPIVEQEIWRALRETGNRQFKVVSNLPYGISIPVIMALLGRSSFLPSGEPVPEGEEGPWFPVSMMIYAVQKEVADRLLAPSGVKDYGPVSIAAQAVARIRRLRKMPPDIFWPRPQVESALIEIIPDENLRARIANPAVFRRLIALLFEQRRKTLLNSLKVSREFGEERPRALAAFGECGIDPARRGETLNVEEAIAVANTLARTERRQGA